MSTASFDVNAVLFWFYALSGVALLSMTAIFHVVYVVRRDSLAGMIAIFLLWVALDMLCRAVLRSPQAIVTQEQVLYVSRASALGVVVSAAMLVDSYLAAHNGHLSVLRRFVLWYRGDDDPIWQRWRDGQHGHGA